MVSQGAFVTFDISRIFEPCWARTMAFEITTDVSFLWKYTTLENFMVSYVLPSFFSSCTAGLQLRAPDRSGHCWTSAATARSQWALPDFIRDCQIAVGTAGLQPAKVTAVVRDFVEEKRGLLTEKEVDEALKAGGAEAQPKSQKRNTRSLRGEDGRRRVVLASSNELKVAEVSRSLANYDIECVRDAHAADSQDAIWETLHQRGEEFWHKAVFKEEMRVFRAPADGLEGFLARVKDHVPEDCTELPSDVLPDGEAVVLFSRLDAYELPKDEAAQIREPCRCFPEEAKFHQQATALHTTPGATGDVGDSTAIVAAAGYVGPTPSERHLVHSTYSSAVEGYVDLSKRGAPEAFGWDDVVVLTSTGKTYQDMLKLRLKFSPRDFNVNRWLIDHVHYKQRKTTNFINDRSKGFSKTISFADSESVASFVAQNEFFNNEVAQRSGLSGVFIAVANNGAFFRSAQSRRELNYWLPGLNAGIPFVAKKDPIHEITFTAHDFGHFLIPDLVFTGNTSSNARRTYIIYRMMSEATTMVFADMLFVETLRLSGYAYDWSKRKIHPLFQETGLKPFDGNRQHFFSEMRKLLEANVEYCLMGSTKKYLELIKQHKGEAENSSQVLDDFKAKYMPFFVEDYRWTSANFQNMAQRAEEYQRWWQMAAPVVQAGRLDGMDNGIGLETAAWRSARGGRTEKNEGPDSPAEELIPKIFQRVFETRLKPVFDGDGYAMEAPHVRLKNAYVRYLVGQMIIFARYDFLEESHRYAAKLTDLVRQKVENFTEETVETARGLYAQFLRVLLRKSLITPDDYEVYQQICPLFDPVYVFYDEQKDFYTQLAEVHVFKGTARHSLAIKALPKFIWMVGHFKVEGMTCASCVGAVERAITALEGVKSAEISLTLKRAEVTYFPSVHAENVVEAIEDVGFEASVLNEVQVHSERTDRPSELPVQMTQSSTQLRKVATSIYGVRGVVVKDAQNARLLYDPVKVGARNLLQKLEGVCRYHEEVLEDPSVATLRRMKHMLLLSLPPTIMIVLLVEGFLPDAWEDEIAGIPSAFLYVLLLSAFVQFYCGSIFHEAAWSAALHKTLGHHIGKLTESSLLIALLTLVCYQGFAVIFFANVEGWTWDQSLYFGMVTMSTVGYGDLYPTLWYSQLVGILFILVGIVVVFGQIIDVVNLVIGPLFQKSRDLVERLVPAHYVDITGNGCSALVDSCVDLLVLKHFSQAGVPDFKVPRRRSIFYGKGLIGPILMLLLFQFISALIFVAVEPEWDLWTAWWYVMVTASTVGYGDNSVNKETLRPLRSGDGDGKKNLEFCRIPENTGALIWASIHILLSVGLLAAIIGDLEVLSEERQELLKQAACFEKCFQKETLQSLDPRPDMDKSGKLSKHEFVLSMLVKIGKLDPEKARGLPAAALMA
eukprot:s480_g17.t5